MEFRPEASETRDQRPETRDQRPETRDQRPETRDQRPETRDQRPETRDQRPETRDQRPETRDQRPETRDQRPETRDQRPETRDQRPETRDQRPETRDQRPLARTQDIVTQDSGSELLIYDLKTNTAMSLNETSARIWRSCNGKRKAADICSYLKESDGVHVNEDLVLLALRQLSDADLLAAKMSESDKPEGVSRRKLLRQIGAGATVALPIILSIVAPQASAAATVVPPAPVVSCTTGLENFRGTCPITSPPQRCVGSDPANRSCMPCLAPLSMVPGGCDVVSGRICCAIACNAITDRCAEGTPTAL